MAEKITKKPSKTVADLSITKATNNYKLTAKWKAGTQLTSPTKKDRATYTIVEWEVIRTASGSNPGDPKVTIRKNSMAGVTSTLDLNSFKSDGKTNFTRSSFYPVTSVYLPKVACRVYSCNKMTSGKNGPYAGKWYKFAAPGAPTVSDLEQGEDTGHIIFSIKPYDDKGGNNERYWTEYVITQTRYGPVNGAMKTTTSTESGHFTDDSEQKWEDTDQADKRHVDVTDRFGVGYDGYTMVTVTARSCGLAGDSAWTGAKSIVVSYPSKPAINGIKVDSTNGTITDTGMVTVSINTNQGGTNGTYHPITGLCLEKLQSTTASTPEQAISRGNEWEATAITDDAHCTALSTSVADLKPTRGTRTWVRVKCWNQFEDKFFRYSDPLEVEDLYLDPATAGGNISITSLMSGDDGTSLIADLEWVETSEIPSTGTELSWSADQNAWRSTTEPQTYEFDASKGIDVRPGPGDLWSGRAQIYIQGLTQGTTYYVRARRYYDDDDGNRTFGSYCDAESAVPSSSPSSAVLNAPSYVAWGEDVPLSWTFDSEAEQTEWHLLAGQTIGGEIEQGEPVPREWVSDPTIADEGSDSSGACVLSFERLATFLEDNQASLSVRVGTGGRLVESDPVVINVVEPPTLSMTVPATVTAQPFALSFESNVEAGLTIIVRAGNGGNMGSSGETPGRNDDQAEGDVVWQTAVTPAWTEDSGTYTATVPTPENTIALIDYGRYVVTATASDPVTGLSSETVEGAFEVDWARKAPAPDPEAIGVRPYDYYDADGNHMRGCTIALYAPVGSDPADVWDMYRLTPDGPYLVAEGLALDAEADDQFAPYGGEGIGYRLVTRTHDGDTDWVDVEYVAYGKDLRIDFGSEYVELPWDLSLSDSYQKDFEARRKLDGSIDGYWNDGVLRKGGFKADLIRVVEQDVAAAVRRLAHHVGPAFVRTPDGCAYQADVQVSDMSGARRDAALAVSLDVTEVALTDQFRVIIPGEGEEEP